MSMIRPIETDYNGYRFRSRIAARWAIFFDALGVPYEYEPECFDMGDGVHYAPDFWLPDQECWMDAGRDFRSKSVNSAASKVAAATLRPVYVFCTPIKPLHANEQIQNGVIHTPAAYAIQHAPEGGYSAPYMWCRCPVCDRLSLEHSGQTEGKCCVGEVHSGLDGHGLENAYLKASLVRFTFNPDHHVYRRLEDE